MKMLTRLCTPGIRKTRQVCGGFGINALVKIVLGAKVQRCGMQVKWSRELDPFLPTATLSSAPS